MRLSALLLGLACGSADDGEGWAGTMETLPSGGVRVTNPAGALWTSENAWRLEPQLVLGNTSGDGADVFASIAAVEVDSSGNIFVLDRQANELRLFDAAGRHLRTVGRAGRGPGEYSTANGLAWIAPDSLLVVDQQGNRYTVLDADGDYVRSVMRRLAFYGWVFVGGIDGDRVYELSSMDHDIRRPALLGTRLRGENLEPGTIESAAASESGPRFIADTLPVANPDGPDAEPFSVQTARGGMMMSVPFAGSPVYYLDGNGGLWYGHGGTPRLYHANFRGDTLTEIVLNIEPAPVTSEEVAEWEAEPSIERFKTMGGKLDLERIPKTKPYFDAITVDAQGYVWLGVPAAPNQTVFAVLDPEGRYLGRLQIDGVSRDIYLAPLVRGGRLYFVGRDELDVQRVYVYRVEAGQNR
jgi:hypothetical protein